MHTKIDKEKLGQLLCLCFGKIMFLPIFYFLRSNRIRTSGSNLDFGKCFQNPIRRYEHKMGGK